MKARTIGSIMLCMAIIAAAGCRDQRRHQVGGAVEMASVNPSLPANAGPQDVAHAILEAIAEAQNSRVKGMGSAAARQQYSEAMARIAAMSAKAEIHKNLKQSGSFQIPKSIDEAGALTMTIESWVSLLAHYVDGYQWSTMSFRSQPTDNNASVYLEAENPADAEHFKQISTAENTEQARRNAAIKMGFNIPIRAGIEVRLIKVDGQWKVSRIELGPATAAAPPPAKVG